VSGEEILERVRILREEIANIRAENRASSLASRRDYLEMQRHLRREARLVEIINELAVLNGNQRQK
jgi:hypothetical protein